MIRSSLDSNILIYAALEPQTAKGQKARHVILGALPGGILAAQALLEFIAVVRRRAPDLMSHAIAQADAWQRVFETAPTTGAVVRGALDIVRDHRLQVWDAVICRAAIAAGAEILFSEDMQDGLALGRLRIIDPFARSESEIQQLLGS